MLSLLSTIGCGPAQIRGVVSEIGHFPMRAALKLLASVVLSLGLTSTAFAHSSINLRDMDDASTAGYKSTAVLPTGVIFWGNFVGPVSWTLATLGNGTYNYALTGVLPGRVGGAVISASTVHLTVDMARRAEGSAITSGDTTREESVPEPSTFALLGTGSLTLLGALRRRNGATRT
jgi:hypothetical protein